ncbi:MAG: YciI-like protein [Sphingomicrobium sp.]
MKHFLLLYTAAPDYLERRGEFRSAHLALAWAFQGRGELVLAGALADPPDGAVLIFQGETAEAAERFASSDPYVANGLITDWKVREWTTVVGDLASGPVRPSD